MGFESDGHRGLLGVAVLAAWAILQSARLRLKRTDHIGNVTTNKNNAEKPARKQDSVRRRGQKRPKRVKVSKEAKALRKLQYEKDKQSPAAADERSKATNSKKIAATTLAAIEKSAAESSNNRWFEVDVEAKLDTGLNIVDAVSSSALEVFCDLKDPNAEVRQGLCIISGPEPLQILLRSKMKVVALALRRPLLDRLQGGLNERWGSESDGGKDRIPVFVLSREQIGCLVISHMRLLQFKIIVNILLTAFFRSASAPVVVLLRAQSYLHPHICQWCSHLLVAGGGWLQSTVIRMRLM